MTKLKELLQNVVDLIDDMKAKKNEERKAADEANVKAQDHRMRALETLRNSKLLTRDNLVLRYLNNHEYWYVP